MPGADIGVAKTLAMMALDRYDWSQARHVLGAHQLYTYQQVCAVL